MTTIIMRQTQLARINEVTNDLQGFPQPQKTIRNQLGDTPKNEAHSCSRCMDGFQKNEKRFVGAFGYEVLCSTCFIDHGGKI